MYRLLIVDDEAIITDAMYDFFQSIEDLELDVYKAYSGNTALQLLNSMKVDIVITDICMPGITGLDLMKEIHLKWPFCRVIFLTGYNEFDYVYQAIKYEGVSYLLKTEDYEEITGAVRQAVKDIEERLEQDDLIARAKEQLFYNRSLILNNYLSDLLYGKGITSQIRQLSFKELNIQLEPELPVLLLIGRFDNPDEDISLSEFTEMISLVQQIVGYYFSKLLNSVSIILEQSRLLWMVQPKAVPPNCEENQDIHFSFEQAVLFIHGMLETIQSVIREKLKKSISFVFWTQEVQWEELPIKFDSLRLLMNYCIGYGEEVILTDRHFKKGYGNPIGQLDNSLVKVRFQQKKVELLGSLLENGKKDDFIGLLSEITGSMEEMKNLQYNPALEIFYAISLMFLSYINRFGLTEKLTGKITLSKLVRLDLHTSYKETIDYFFRLSEFIFGLQNDDHECNTYGAVEKVKHYVEQNLEGDISLIHLAEQVSLNPSYLSRLFKQVTGINLLTYINDAKISRAKELLMQKNLKITDIAQKVGFFSYQYFNRTFKKATRMSPQEYRDSCKDS